MATSCADIVLWTGIAEGVLLVLGTIRSYRLRLGLRRADEMIRGVLHDLRTPLAHIRLGAELLHEGKGDGRSAAESIAESCNALTDLVDMYAEISLNYARVSEGPAVRQDLRPVIDDLVDLYSAVSETRGISFELDVPQQPVPFRGHRHKVQQLIANLLDNAFKFTPDGGTVRLSAGASGSRVKIRVSDTGIGISRKDRARIYERFFRVDRRRTPGNGLGLSLVHAIVTFYHGTIECRSTPGCGTDFLVTLRDA